VSLELVETRVDLAIIQCLGAFTDRFEQDRFRVEFRVDTKDVQHDSRSGSVITTTDYIAITNDEEQLPFVIIVEGRKRINCPTE
jgi:hypothetical protein